METRQNNDVIDYIDLVYVKTKIELFWPIWSGAVYIENDIEL